MADITDALDVVMMRIDAVNHAISNETRAHIILLKNSVDFESDSAMQTIVGNLTLPDVKALQNIMVSGRDDSRIASIAKVSTRQYRVDDKGYRA